MDWLIDRVRTDNNYYDFIRKADYSIQPILDMWRDNTGNAVHNAANAVADAARQTLNTMMYEHGTMDKKTQYYEGCFRIVNPFYQADQILASPLATKEDKAKATKAIILWASIWTDDNHTPSMKDLNNLHTETCLGYGTLNQGICYMQYRDMFISYLPNHPQFKAMVPGVLKRVVDTLKWQISEDGAHMAGTGYVEASYTTLCSLFLQLKQAGVKDFFKDDKEIDYRLTKHSEFMMACMTPPEPRFGNRRKIIAIGDSQTRGSDRWGITATGFVDRKSVV